MNPQGQLRLLRTDQGDRLLQRCPAVHSDVPPGLLKQNHQRAIELREGIHLWALARLEPLAEYHRELIDSYQTIVSQALEMPRP